LALLILKNNIMTVEKLFYRFIKENGLFNAVKKQVKENNKFRTKKTINPLQDIIPNMFFINRYSIEKLFYEAFKYYPIFSGTSQSGNRKKFYKLNKKWKKFVSGKCFVQHNISIGDKIEFYDWPKTLRVGVVASPYKDAFSVIDSTYGYKRLVNVFSIKGAQKKDLVINLYYKDENGFTYGKIDGNYNEIQL